jgi:hypothetical protein
VTIFLVPLKATGIYLGWQPHTHNSKRMTQGFFIFYFLAGILIVAFIFIVVGAGVEKNPKFSVPS